MKTIFEKIWRFVNSKIFIVCLLITLFLIIFGQHSAMKDLKRDIVKKEQNIAAADSTINRYKDKENRWNEEKAIWILTEKELKKEKEDLYEEVKKQKGRVISLNKVIFQLKQDTAILHDSIRYLTSIISDPIYLGEGEWKLPWSLEYTWDNTNFDIFRGHTRIKVDTLTGKIIETNTLMDERFSQIDLIFGEKVVDGKYNVYVTSTYPGLTSKSMQGVFIDPNSNKDIKKLIEKRHWFTGFSLSVGITPTWDFINKQPTIVIGPTIGYTIYQW